MNYASTTMQTANRILSHMPKTTDRMKVDRSKALKLSHQATKLKQLLSAKDEVCFTYAKSTGELREARGNQFFKAKDNPYLVTYFDLDKQAIRSCRVDRIIEISTI